MWKRFKEMIEYLFFGKDSILINPSMFDEKGEPEDE